MFTTRDYYYYFRELYDNGKYEKAIEIFNKTLAGNDLWIEDRICAIELKARCQIALKQYNNAIETLLQSFIYDIPRANILCVLGDTFLYMNCHNLAIYWCLRFLLLQANSTFLLTLSAETVVFPKECSHIYQEIFPLFSKYSGIFFQREYCTLFRFINDLP